MTLLTARSNKRRLTVIGLPGAGKTTMARQVSQLLALPHIELDALYWDSNWVPAEPKIFRQRTAQALSQDAWLVEGNYCQVCDLVWQQADSLIWLDLSLAVLMSRLLARTLRNLLTRNELWNGNIEQWHRCFLSRKSIFLKLLKNYHPKRREILTQLNQPEYSHLQVIHLRSPQAVKAYLLSISELDQTDKPRWHEAQPLGALIFAS